jgi:hypothetical protein
MRTQGRNWEPGSGGLASVHPCPDQGESHGDNGGVSDEGGHASGGLG